MNIGTPTSITYKLIKKKVQILKKTVFILKKLRSGSNTKWVVIIIWWELTIMGRVVINLVKIIANFMHIPSKKAASPYVQYKLFFFVQNIFFSWPFYRMIR